MQPFLLTYIMALLFKTILLMFIIPFVVVSDCKLLPNGNYRVKFIHDSAESSYRLKIDGNNYYQYWDNGDSAKGLIEWVYNCDFILNDTTKKDTSDIGKLLHMGKPQFEVHEAEGDTIPFRLTYSGNLEVTINDGVIIRLH